MARTTGGGRRLAVSAVAISTLAGIAAFLYLYLPEDLTAALWILTACSLALAGGVALQARVLARQAVQLSSDLDVVSERLLRLQGEGPPPAGAAPRPRLHDPSPPRGGAPAAGGDGARSQARRPVRRRAGSDGRDRAPRRDRARPRGRSRGPRPRARRPEGGRRKAGPGAARGAKARPTDGSARPRTGF